MIARAAQNSLDSNLLASFFRHKAVCRYYNISPRQSTKTSHQLLKSLVLKSPSSCTSKSSYENNSNNNNHKNTQRDHNLLTHLFHSKNNNDRFQRLTLSLSLSPPIPKLLHKATHRSNKKNNNNQGGIQTRLVPRKKLSKLC
jgi:hypothetical protein